MDVCEKVTHQFRLGLSGWIKITFPLITTHPVFDYVCEQFEQKDIRPLIREEFKKMIEFDKEEHEISERRRRINSRR